MNQYEYHDYTTGVLERETKREERREVAKNLFKKVEIKTVGDISDGEFYKTALDIIGPVKEWPAAIRRAVWMREGHMNHRQRFATSVFFMANGLNPEIWYPWIVKKHGWDNDAVKDFTWVKDKYANSNWKAWNVSQKRSI